MRAREGGYEHERLLADEEEQDGALNQDESCPPNSLPVYMTIHK